MASHVRVAVSGVVEPGEHAALADVVEPVGLFELTLPQAINELAAARISKAPA